MQRGNRNAKARDSKSRKLLAAAVASVAFTGTLTPATHGALMVDLRAINGTGYTISGGGKTVAPNSFGVTVIMAVYARVSGTNASQNVFEFDDTINPVQNITTNDDTINSVVGSFQSVGPLLGNMAPIAGPITSAGFTTPITPFNAPGQQNGTAADWDSDGDLDIGAAGSGADPTPMFASRAADPTSAAVSDEPSRGWAQGGNYTVNNNESLINASTGEMRIGTLRFIVSGGSGSANINFVVRPTNDAGAALWFEDGANTGKNPGNGAFSLGAPVLINSLLSVQNLVWNPPGTTWTVGASNWLKSGSPAAYANGDFVTFGNTGVGTVNVDAAGVSPGSVTISNSSGTYTFSGGSINGFAAVVMSGAGTAIFTAPNGYGGGTTISGGGTLVADGGDNRLGLASGSVTFNNGTLRTQTTGITSTRNLIVNSGGGTFDTNGFDSSTSGILSGSGAFVKAGAGTLTLTGTNTHTGPKLVAAGTLQIGNGGTTGSITGQVNDNANLAFNRSDAITFAGTIEGSGSLTKLGAGTLTLTSAANYTGGTTISSGVLQIGAGGNTGSITGNVVDNANITFNRSDNISFAGSISGGGSLTKLLPNTLTLLGDNTYAGATTISAGILSVGNGGTTGSIVGNVVDTTKIIFNRSNASTYPGAISGSGSLTKDGPGTLVLTGANTLTGVTNITNGALQIGNGGTTGSLAGGVTGPGTLAFNRSNSFQFGGPITGGAAVVQMGGEVSLLSAANAQPSTTVLNGTLNVNSNSNLGLDGVLNALDLHGGTTLRLTGPVSMARTVFLGDGNGTVTLAAPGGQSLGFTGTGGTGINGPIVITFGSVTFNRYGGLIGVGPGSSVTVNPGATLNLSGQPVFFDGVDRVNVINNSTAGFNVIDGAHEIGTVSGTGNTKVSGGATLTATHIRQGTLNVSGTAAIHPNGGAIGVSRLANLILTGSGTFDLGNNKLIATAMPAGSWNGVAYTGVTGLVQAGRNGNTPPLWDGVGIVTTQSTNGNYTSIGVAAASDVRPVTATSTTLWAGQTIRGADTLVMYTYGGDANLDGKLNIDDYIKIDQGIALGLSGWSNGDFNYDGKIDIDDYTTVIDSNIGAQAAPFYTAGAVNESSVVAVPEPAGGILALAALGLTHRRRRGGRIV